MILQWEELSMVFYTPQTTFPHYTIKTKQSLKASTNGLSILAIHHNSLSLTSFSSPAWGQWTKRRGSWITYKSYVKNACYM